MAVSKTAVNNDILVTVVTILIFIGIITLFILIKKKVILKSDKSQSIAKAIAKVLWCVFWAYNLGEGAISPFILYSSKSTDKSWVWLLLILIGYALILVGVVFGLKKCLKKWLYILSVNITFIIIPLIFAIIGVTLPSEWFVYNTDDYMAKVFLSIATQLGFSLTHIICLIAFLIYNSSLLIKFIVNRVKSKKVADNATK